MKRQGSTALVGATISEHDGLRYLHLGTEWVQGAMRIRKPRELPLEYARRMMAWMLWRPTETLTAGHAVHLGLGAASNTRYTHQVLRMRTTTVEINPTVIAACRLWFHLPQDDERLTVLLDDAGRWIADPENLQSADVLCVDLYDHEAAAPVLDDEAFYAACRAALAPGGLMTVNLFGRNASFERSAGCIGAAFGAGQVWHLPPTLEGNTIVVAGRDVAAPDRETLQARADAVEARYGLPCSRWPKFIRPWEPPARAA